MPIQHSPKKPNQDEGESEIFRGFPDETDRNKSIMDNIAADAQTISQLNPLFRLRRQTHLNITRIKSIIDNADIPVTLAQLRVYARKLQSLYDEFSGFHNQILAIIPDEEIENQEAECQRFEDIYDLTSTIIEHSLMQNNVADIAQAVPPQVIIHQQPLKAPIPTFDGDYTKWPKFKAMFLDVMAQSVSRDAIKLYHLDKALIGSAAGVLDSKTINEGNYTKAWNILTERYENRRVIIETHIRGLLQLQKMSTESNIELRKLVDECNNHVESLEYMEQELLGMSELIIIYLLTAALDKTTRKHWEQTLKPGQLPKYKTTIEFLKSQCQVLERCEAAFSLPIPKPFVSKSGTQIKINNQRTHAAVSDENYTNEKCDFCAALHRNYQCDKLNALSSAEKMNKIKSTGVCFNCLRKGHISKKCPSSKTCRICKKRHHTQLHEDVSPMQNSETIRNEKITVRNQPTNDKPSTSNENQMPVSTCSCNSARVSKTVLLLTAVVLVTDKNGRQHSCRALLDSGSLVNFVSEKFANVLEIPKRRVNIAIAGISSLKTTAHEKIIVKFQSQYSNFQASLECLITRKVTGKIPSMDIDITDWNIPSGIQLADPMFYKSNTIDILIGAELFFKLLKPFNQLVLEDGLPELRDSHLGWIVTGSISADNNVQYSQIASIQSIEDSIEKFWQIEELQDDPKPTTDEQRCEEHFSVTHSRDETGRFVVRLPFKDNINELISCRELALKRFYMLESKLQRNPDLKSQYIDFVREYQQLGHCKEVDETKDMRPLNPYFMPHHAVLRPDSSTTKCRVVFDASAKPSSSDLSLNDVLLVGPVVQNELLAIILKFRKHKYVFTGDITKMYRQILKVLELTTITYGTASAPFQATRCLIQLAKEEESNFPIASNIIRKDCYVDDVISGADTFEEANEAINQLRRMLAKGGFPIRKWCSNSTQLLHNCPTEEQETLKPWKDRSINSVTKILGLTWNPLSDELLIAGELEHIEDQKRRTTKRRIYSEVAKLYAPLGLYSPTVVLAKLLVQQLWKCKIGWDDSVEESFVQQWCNIKQTLPHLKKITIPRQVTYIGAIDFELHGFTDSSNLAYGACVYVRSLFPDGSAKCRLLSSKSKVAPLHELTIPRKELCAALLLTRLVKKIIDAVEMNFSQIMLWTDSQIVLAWLKKNPDRLQTFVKNRVMEIRNGLGECQWNYVKSCDNPADVVSRGQLPTILAQNDMWWNGPNFLTTSTIIFETLNDVPEENLPEMKPVIMSHSATILELLQVFSKYSCFRKLQRVIGWILRFKNNCHQKNNHIIQRHLTVAEIRESTTTIIRVIQHIEFGDEIRRLKSGLQCKILGPLNPIYATNLLRVGGRLKNSNLKNESIHQLILPNKNIVTALIIRTMHNELLHIGVSGLVSATRQRFWIINARSTIRQIIRSCVKCFRTNPTGVSQLMGDLPKQRVSPAPPFNITGVDYAGPVMDQNEVKQIEKFCLKREMEWHFIPPDAPEFGGLWEAAVKSTKTHLKRVLGNALLTFEEMATILCEIEAILNSRPLFAISNDPTDLEVITPAHFLIGRQLTAVPEPSYTNEKIGRLNRWQHIQLMRQHFWNAWSNDYLNSLQLRKKNWITSENIQPGMIVLLQDKNRPPLQWKLGRIVAVHPGSDNLIRVVDVCSGGTSYRRPITKLSVLPIEVNQREPESSET
ncbi:uncharacterized protein LOC129774572 [Toxorhynchites rutilus septentrionalis]|uniref:uncharacterized protein LOC129774572 n=1 Tax=Toxorhynchites rutilus septentrionalis TaxID=329112 RepID=UPI002479933D|nr:uncharacterized protein LOC129774572 [Toxorhynchites rutilus septentrionalis]